ncbi:MAG: hypothetical protein AMXMBFR33_60210 [Candidatus Xenobia bacterium]
MPQDGSEAPSLTTPGGLSGRVTDQSGLPAGGVTISLFEANVRARSLDAAIQGKQVASSQSDDQGQFKFDGLAVGDYNLIAEQSTDSKASAAVTVTGEAQDLGTLGLEPTATVTGRVIVVGRTDASGITVFILGSNLETQTDASGRYTLTGVPSGSFRMFASSDIFASLSVVEIQPGPGQAVVAPDLILVPIAGNFTGVVAFSVKDSETTSPLVGATVRLGEETRNTDSTGLALFDATAVGRQQFQVTMSGYQDVSDAVDIVGGGQVVREVSMLPAALMPTDVKAEPTGNNQVTITWSLTSDPEATYDVLRSETEGTGFQKINAGPLTTAKFDDQNLESLRSYFYQVRSVKGAAVSRVSETVQATAFPFIYQRILPPPVVDFAIGNQSQLLLCRDQALEERLEDLSLLRQYPVSNPTGVAQNPATGEVFVSRSAEVLVFASSGTLLRLWNVPTRPGGPHSLDLTLDPSGNVWVRVIGSDDLDSQFSEVMKFDANGNLLLTLTGHSSRVTDLDTDSHGRVYLADSGSRLVRRYSSSGAPEITWGGSGTGPGEFGDPASAPGVNVGDRERLILTVGPDDSIFVWSGTDCRIQKFTPDGIFRCQFGSRDESGADFNVGQFFVLGELDTDGSGNLYVLQSGGVTPGYVGVGQLLDKFGPLP